MLDSIHSSLKDLEKSFMLSYKEVNSETKTLQIVLDKFGSKNSNVKLKKSDVLNVAKTIEYKLNLIRDFPEYFTNIKFKKK